MVTVDERLARLERPKSDAAVWCYRLALFAIPFFAIVIGGHRIGAIETQPVFWMLGLGVLILVGSVVAGVRGFHQLWTYGHEAGLSAAKGIFLATLMLLPFVYQGAKAIVLPPIHDISTDLEDIPSFDSVIDVRTDAMNSLDDPSSEERELQLLAYPKVAARRYPLGEGRVFRTLVELIGDRGWTILTSNIEQGEAPIDAEGSGLVARPIRDAEGRPLRPALPTSRPSVRRTVVPGGLPFETQQVSPIGRADSAVEQQERYIEAVATSFLFGFPSDIVVRLIEEEEGTLVDMRASSRWGPHDLGANANTILDFLLELDTSLQGLNEGT